MVLLVMKQTIGKLTKMKRLKTILLFLVICISCFGQNRTRTNTNQRVIWEYKVVKVNDYFYNNNSHSCAFNPPKFYDQTAMLNEMGNKGWELVNVYTEVSTVFGTNNNRYNGNTKTQVINFVFKRPKSGK